MVKYLTLDSSVFVTALRKDEEYHKQCLELLTRIKDGEYIAIEPVTVLVEIVAAIRRRTNSKKLAQSVKDDMLAISSINFFGLDMIEAEKAADLAAEIGARGMDAIVIHVAREQKTVFVTLDTEMAKVAKDTVKIKGIKELTGQQM